MKRRGPASGRRFLQAGLWFLALSAALPGLWALFAPRSFYDDFPGLSSWVSALPPYNEHLTTDVGAFYLGFAVLLAGAALRPHRLLVRVALLAWLVAQVPHLIFHARHLDGLATVDVIAQTATFVLVVVLPVILLFRLRSAERF